MYQQGCIIFLRVILPVSVSIFCRIPRVLCGRGLNVILHRLTNLERNLDLNPLITNKYCCTNQMNINKISINKYNYYILS